MATASITEQATSLLTEVSGRVPDDPIAFVAAAERATNEGDESVLEGLYAPDVYFENLVDGIHDCYQGEPAVVRAWRAYSRGLHRQNLRVTKSIITVSEDTIVNDWRGTIAGGRPVCGVEIWNFDERQRVRRHQLLGSLAARSSMDPRSVPKLATSYPRTTVALVRQLLGLRVFPNAKPAR